MGSVVFDYYLLTLIDIANFFTFFKGNTPCETSYADRNGKYMKQKGIVVPRM